MTPTLPADSNDSEPVASDSDEDDEGIRKFLDVNTANQGYKTSAHHSSHGIEMSPPSLLENDSDEGGNNDETKRSNRRGASTDGLGTARAATDGDGSSVQDDVRVAQRSADLIQKEMIKLGDNGKKVGKFGGGFSLIDLIRPLPLSGEVGFEEEEEEDDNNPANDEDTGPSPEEDELHIPKSMREIYSLSNANRRRTGKEKVTSKPLQLPDDGDTDPVEKFEEDDIQGAETIISGYFGSPNNSKKRTAPIGREDDIKLMIKMGWVKDSKEAEALAVVPADLVATAPAEKDKHGGGGGIVPPHHKKSSLSNAASSGGGGGRGGGDAFNAFNYYSSSAGIGAFDPSAPPPKNPFFAGAATSAASMVHGGESKGKPHKRNKKQR
jgi:hypothetical protein